MFIVRYVTKGTFDFLSWHFREIFERKPNEYSLLPHLMNVCRNVLKECLYYMKGNKEGFHNQEENIRIDELILLTHNNSSLLIFDIKLRKYRKNRDKNKNVRIEDEIIKPNFLEAQMPRKII